MSGLRRTVHPKSDFSYKPLSEVAPDLVVAQRPPEGNGGEPEQPMALVFTDIDDQEQHVYVFSDKGRQNLIRELTGGIVLPG